MRSEHQSLLFCTSVRWFSRGKVLARLFELQSEAVLTKTEQAQIA